MTLSDKPQFFDPDDPRMAGKRYLTDDDPLMRQSRAAFLAWVETAQPKEGDPVPREARLWFLTRTRMARVAVDLQSTELWIHEYPDWRSVRDEDYASMYSHAAASDVEPD